jgi:hypothetical protein
MHIICHFQSVWPEVRFDCVGPSISSVNHHGPGQILHVANSLSGHSVLEVGIYTAVGNSLATGSHIVDPDVLGKSSIVSMVVPNLHTVGGTAGLKLSLLALCSVLGSR